MLKLSREISNLYEHAMRQHWLVPKGMTIINIFVREKNEVD
jgi:hypothetical protein